jgi:hypothetical protein
MGGLRTVLEQNLAEVVGRTGDNDTCIYDPNCMVANRGADHGCLQLPEPRARPGTGSSVVGSSSEVRMGR